MTMLVLLLAALLSRPLPPKPMPADLCVLDYDSAETLEDADVAAARVTRAAIEQREAAAAWTINELLDTLTIQP
jgi:hypothetical protein